MKNIKRHLDLTRRNNEWFAMKQREHNHVARTINETEKKMLEVKIKRLHPSAVVPHYARPGDAGMDLYATVVDYDKYGNLVCHTGLAMEIPEGHVGLLFPRSSIAKTPLSLCNSVGVIDSGYRGEIVLKFNREDRYTAEGTVYIAGNRVGQIIIMPYPKVGFVETEHLSETVRGEGAFGSTGLSEQLVIDFANGGQDNE